LRPGYRLGAKNKARPVPPPTPRAPGGQVRGPDLERPADAEAVPSSVVWASRVALGAAILGMGVATYLTIAHYDSSVTLACPGSPTGLVDCARVTTSPQSKFLGIPVAVLGLFYFVSMVVANLPQLWRLYIKEVVLARAAFSVVGMGFALYLIAMELFVIGQICIWCTAAHFLAFVLLVSIIGASGAVWPWCRSWRERAS